MNFLEHLALLEEHFEGMRLVMCITLRTMVGACPIFVTMANKFPDDGMASGDEIPILEGWVLLYENRDMQSRPISMWAAGSNLGMVLQDISGCYSPLQSKFSPFILPPYLNIRK